MATTDPPRKPANRPWNETIEHCDTCGEAGPHEVGIEFRSESPDPTHARSSREPYRVATCCQCGDRTIARASTVRKPP